MVKLIEDKQQMSSFMLIHQVVSKNVMNSKWPMKYMFHGLVELSMESSPGLNPSPAEPGYTLPLWTV